MCKINKSNKLKKTTQKISDKTKEGFTLVEVMLVLAITSLMLAGLIGGTFGAIARQRYQDALNDFAEYLSRMYSEVISPETFGVGSSSNQAILGKILVFGYDYPDNADNSRSVYSATLVGSADINYGSDLSFLEELAASSTNIQIVCGNNATGQESSVEHYLPLWQTALDTTQPASRFRGTLIIARTPTSSTVHTIFSSDRVYDLRNQCTPTDRTADTLFRQDLQAPDGTVTYRDSIEHSTTICVKSDDSSIVRAVEITADGSNTSAVKTLSEEGSQACE